MYYKIYITALHNAHLCMLKRSLMQLGVVPLAACALCGVQNFHKPRSAHAITVSGLSTGVFHQRTCGQREVLPLEIGSEGPHLSRVSVLFFPPPPPVLLIFWVKTARRDSRVSSDGISVNPASISKG